MTNAPVKSRDLSTIGIVGGGTMGAGIATSALLADLNATLIDLNEEAASSARNRITQNLRGALSRNKITQEQFNTIVSDKLIIATQLDFLSNADIIIEAVFEDMATKQTVFKQLEAIAKPDAVLATNTSYLDINEIAKAVAAPENVIGLHFFSPAHIMRLLEVVVAEKTAQDVVATGMALGNRMNKVAVTAGVCDGFIGNRLLAKYRSCADNMVLDGASPYQIDNALEAFGFKMGPFAVADLAGLDIAWANRKRLAASRHQHDRYPGYADALCERGQFGQKTDKGFYQYKDKKREENPDAIRFINEERNKQSTNIRTFSDEEIVKRYMAAMVNEACNVMHDGIAQQPSDIDLVLLHGYGFPKALGGPMVWADDQGLSAILSDIENYAQDDAHYWQPAALLQTLVATGQRFADLNKDTT